MTDCRILDVDLASPYSHALDAKSPTETLRYGHAWDRWAACRADGVNNLASTWTIHPDDDDGTVTITQQTVIGDEIIGGVTYSLTASFFMAGGTAGKSYRIINTTDWDDGSQVTFTAQIPVRDVFKQALAA